MRKKIFKNLLVCILMGVMMMDIFGCGQAVSNEEFAKEYLKKEYNEEFEIERVVGVRVFDGYYTVMAYPVEKPELIFTAKINSDGTGGSDNYVSKMKCLELSDRLAQNLDAVQELYYIYSEPLYDPMIKDKNITLEEYMATNPDRLYNVYLAINPGQQNVEEIYKAVAGMCKGMDSLNINLLLYVAGEDGIKEICEYMENHDVVEDDFDHSGGQYYKGNFKFKKGQINIGVEEFARMMRG